MRQRQLQQQHRTISAMMMIQQQLSPKRLPKQLFIPMSSLSRLRGKHFLLAIILCRKCKMVRGTAENVRKGSSVSFSEFSVAIKNGGTRRAGFGAWRRFLAPDPPQGGAAKTRRKGLMRVKNAPHVRHGVRFFQNSRSTMRSSISTGIPAASERNAASMTFMERMSCSCVTNCFAFPSMAAAKLR